MAAWRYEMSLLVLKKYFTHSLRSLVKYFLTLEEKFRISAQPCNILYVINEIVTCNCTTNRYVNKNKDKYYYDSGLHVL